MLKLGDGNCIVSLAFDILPSFLPFGTSHVGPPDSRARISAQETTPGQKDSSAFFALSMTKNECKDKFGGPSFSALLFPTEFNSTDASQPFTTLNKASHGSAS